MVGSVDNNKRHVVEFVPVIEDGIRTRPMGGDGGRFVDASTAVNDSLVHAALDAASRSL
jgi:hypothetical protein